MVKDIADAKGIQFITKEECYENTANLVDLDIRCVFLLLKICFINIFEMLTRIEKI